MFNIEWSRTLLTNRGQANGGAIEEEPPYGIDTRTLQSAFG